MLSNDIQGSIKSQVKEAIWVLRLLNLWQCDAGKHNILYDEATGKTTILDFEIMDDADGDDGMELCQVFGSE